MSGELTEKSLGRKPLGDDAFDGDKTVSSIFASVIGSAGIDASVLEH